MAASESSPLLGGLLSVTFRKLSAEQIVDLVVRSGLPSIEWGGDVHVPHGDLPRARQVRKMTADAGLIISAYGSYYRCTPLAETAPAWSAVADTAMELGASTVRVWAGTKDSGDASADERARVVADLQNICLQAAAQCLTIDLEYHGGTLTNTLASTVELLREVGAPNLRSYWQPRHGVATDESTAEVRTLAPHLGNLHVFHWWPTNATRHPLAAGTDRWKAFLAAVPRDGRQRFASLEFVLNDSPDQFLEDAATLRALLAMQ